MSHYYKPRPGSEFERSTATEYNHGYYENRLKQDEVERIERNARSAAFFAQKTAAEAASASTKAMQEKDDLIALLQAQVAELAKKNGG